MFDIRQSRRALWLIVQDFLNLLFALFGAPEEIAARHTLARAHWALLAKWLRAGEALMRQLLLIEAAQLPKPNARPILWPKHARKRRPVCFGADAPETWRVSFRALLPDRRRLAGGDAGSPGKARRPRLSREARWSCADFRPQSFHSAWPLAERAEALLRVFNDPLPYAKRLARRLFATPHRAGSLLQHPPDAPALVGAEHFAASSAAAHAARRRFDTS